MLDNSFIALHLKRKALNSNEPVDLRMALDWSKISSDDNFRMLKHEEGSKLTISKNVIDDLRDVIDVSNKEDDN
jgi:hypothetical protein